MSNEYLLKNVLLASGWKENVLIAVSASGRIESITENVYEHPKTERITGPTIPGMANVHSHAFQSAFAGYTESSKGHVKDNFWSWRTMMYQFVGRLTPSQQHIIAKQLYIDCLKSGYTTVGEFHYLHHDQKGINYSDPAETSHQVINAALETGIGITHLPVYYRYAGFADHSKTALVDQQLRFVHEPEDYFQLLDVLSQEYNNHDTVKLGIAPHSLRAVNYDDINDALNHLNSVNKTHLNTAPVHIHIAEQHSEVEECKQQTGQTPVAHLMEHCAVDQRWCLIHATHIDEQEVRLMVNRASNAGLCLTTEANLGDGIFPSQQYIANNGRFCIGSDSHISVSPFEELRLLEYTQRLQLQRRNVFCDHTINSVGRFLFENAARNGSQALDRDSGTIEVGKNADWLVLDIENTALFNKSDDQLLDAAIFAARKNPVKDVMVQGKWVVKDGQHPLEDSVFKEYKAVLFDLMS